MFDNILDFAGVENENYREVCKDAAAGAVLGATAAVALYGVGKVIDAIFGDSAE